MKTEKLLIYSLAAIGVGALSIELSRYQFSSGVKKRITTRDKDVCQVDGCLCTEEITAHHIIPESCLNDNSLSGAGKYVDDLHEIFDEINSERKGSDSTIKHLWFKFIKHSITNGVTLCSYHHVGLHTDSFTDKELILKKHDSHPDRPRALTVKEIGRFIWDAYDHVSHQARLMSKKSHAQVGYENSRKEYY